VMSSPKASTNSGLLVSVSSMVSCRKSRCDEVCVNLGQGQGDQFSHFDQVVQVRLRGHPFAFLADMLDGREPRRTQHNLHVLQRGVGIVREGHSPACHNLE
jgi:hypothetical protein